MAVPTGVAAEEMMAEPISITVGGNSHWGIAVVDNEMDTADGNGEKDDIAISNDVELKFSGSTVLDSGVEVGVRIEIEGEQSGDQGDETYMYVEGSFGTIRVGNDDAASAQMATTAPYATYFYGINTPYWSGTISGDGSNWHTTLAGADVGDSASMMYFSPVFNGFQFGVSYAPEAGAEARSGTADRSKDGDAYSVGLRYDGNFGDAGVTISAGYTSQDVPKIAAVPSRVAMHDVMIKDFMGNDMRRYLKAPVDTNDPVASTGSDTAKDVRVFQRNEWKKPTRDQFKHASDNMEEEVEAFNAAVKSYEDAIKLNDDGEPTRYSFEADYNADGSTETVYQYQEVNASNVYYNTDAKAAVPGRTVSDYSAGVVVSMSGVSVGGSYRSIDHDIKDADDTVHWDVGVSYGEGPWVVSANYGAKTQDDDGEGNKTDNGYARLMANYNLGPGIDLAGVIGQDTFDGGEDTSFAGIAMGISF